MFQNIIKQLNRLLGTNTLSTEMTEAEVLNHLEDMAPIAGAGGEMQSQIAEMASALATLQVSTSAQAAEITALRESNDHILGRMQSAEAQLVTTVAQLQAAETRLVGIDELSTTLQSNGTALANEINAMKGVVTAPAPHATTEVPTVPAKPATATAVKSNLLTERLKGLKISQFQIN